MSEYHKTKDKPAGNPFYKYLALFQELSYYSYGKLTVK
jgi:hypothetical protein